MRTIRLIILPLLLLTLLRVNGQQRIPSPEDTVISPATKQDSHTIRKPDTPKKPLQETFHTQTKPDITDSPGVTLKSEHTNPTSEIHSDSTLAHISPRPIDSLSVIAWVLKQNKWINSIANPVFFVSNEKSFSGKEVFFYVMCGLLLLLGLFKAFYSHYFSNIFSVYFNTSLRQSQLSEQLLQARLPSFLLNIFFVIVAGIFIWLWLSEKQVALVGRPWMLFQISVASVAFIYLGKYCFLKFIGWVSGISEATDYYIFIIFLVNKILGLLLLPFIILLAFGRQEWFGIVETLALLSVGVLFVSRYVKSYALAGQKLSIRPFHFLLFIAGAEVIPILLIYKVAVDYLLK